MCINKYDVFYQDYDLSNFEDSNKIISEKILLNCLIYNYTFVNTHQK